MGPAPRRRRKPGPSLREVSNVFFQCRDRRRPVLSPNLHSSRVCRYNIGWWHRHGAAHGTGSAALATSDKTLYPPHQFCEGLAIAFLEDEFEVASFCKADVGWHREEPSFALHRQRKAGHTRLWRLVRSSRSAVGGVQRKLLHPYGRLVASPCFCRLQVKKAPRRGAGRCDAPVILDRS
jgi:hypothetical protein